MSISHHSRFLLLAVLVFAAAASYFAISSPREARGYSFSWPTQPYLADIDGNYAYRGLSFSWSGCSGGWCWYSNLGTYVNITSPSAGYHYDSYALVTGGSEGIFPTTFDGGTTYLVYSNTPYTVTGQNFTVDHWGQTSAIGALCGNQYCAAQGTYQYQGALLAAVVPSGATSANCSYKGYPNSSGCY